jgi:uncharacterized Zn finger protein
MAWGNVYGEYVSAAERRRKAAQLVKKLTAKGQRLDPISIAGNAIASTFWGKAWCKNLEQYSDFANRLPRGRTYVRNGSVIDLQIAPGKVTALVSGSDIYKIAIGIKALPPARWEALKRASTGKITNLLDLLQGRLSKDMLTAITDASGGIFPESRELEFKCSCPDGAYMCKHVAAALYGVGARLDARPELFFILRAVDMQELISAASAQATAPLSGRGASKKRALADADLAGIFGVEMDTDAAAVPPAPKPARGTRGKSKRTGKG